MKKFGFVVFAVVLSLFVSNKLIAREKMQRGKIVVFIKDDFANEKSEVKYFLQLKDTTLVPVPAERIGDFPPRSGQRAILSPGGKLRYSRNKATGITFNKISGKINVLIALVQPLDEDVPWEAEKAKEYFQSSKDFLEDPRQHSQVELSVEVVGWLKSKKTKSELTSSSGKLSPAYGEAINLTDDFVNYNEVDCLFIVVAEDSLNWTWHSAGASLGKSLRQTNDEGSNFSHVSIGSGFFSSSSSANSHELGHAVLGFYHGGGENVSRENECGYSRGKAEDYKDHFDVMGNYYFFFSALRQYLVGWLLKERVTTLSASASVELYPREIANSNGKQLIIIKINDDGFYTVELCVKELESYNDNESIGDGLLLRYHDGDSLPRDDGSRYDSIIFLQKDNDNESFLRPGEEICGLGTKGDISIKYVSLEGKGEGAIAKVEIKMSESTPTPTPSPTPTPTLTPTLTPTPTPTPCKPDIISISSGSSINIKKKTSGKVTVEVTSANGCAVEGEMVEAIVTSASGQKRIAVSPPEGETDENGQVVFTITAQKKFGNAVVAFWAGNLKTFLYVKVSKK